MDGEQLEPAGIAGILDAAHDVGTVATSDGVDAPNADRGIEPTDGPPAGANADSRAVDASGGAG
ncbi:hypothetical protein [Synoicihabitans lomoniglobus]|uniref:Uncharacterized protein n=1 Tax=Synoicihabitans lomoniglobus TaxID=2909285 RepID=A0AAE9ZT17_9BACT|nr:hypothetical protein [Opitutaceae bacterium LMO-M01]WED63736.1 hypothetical protein PXH66_15475 [Opitutaceae bacterium LMO-M01]